MAESTLIRGGTVQEDGSEQVVARQQVRAAPVEAHLALLHEVGVLGEVQRDVDGLLDQYDSCPVVVDLADHVEQLAHDHGRQAE